MVVIYAPGSARRLSLCLSHSFPPNKGGSWEEGLCQWLVGLLLHSMPHSGRSWGTWVQQASGLEKRVSQTTQCYQSPKLRSVWRKSYKTVCWVQPIPSQSPGNELHFVSLFSERRTSYNNKWLQNSQELTAILVQQIFLHSRWGRPWIERDQPAAEWKSFQNLVTCKCKHWHNFQGVPKWTPQSLALPWYLLRNYRGLHILWRRDVVCDHIPMTHSYQTEVMQWGWRRSNHNYFRGSAGTNIWTELRLGLAFHCLVALAIKITYKLAPAVSRFHH